jgi:hypothetical protein
MKRLTVWILAMALAVPLMAPSPAHAAKKYKNIKVGEEYRGTVSFTSRPRMALVPDTRIYYLRDAADYDLYQTGNFWYLLEDGKWYRARSWDGTFTYVHTNSVPRAVRTLPRGYRRSYTPTSPNVSGRYRGSAVNFTTMPRMAIIPDTRVYYVRDESDLDLYQYGNRWYLVENGAWYQASSWRGPFVSIRANAVPREVMTVPSGYRRNWVSTSSTSSNTGAQIGSVYRGSALRFDSQPSMGTIPDSRVTYVRDDTNLDLYRFNNNWYYIENGTWYRSPNWQGPFVSMRTSNVPRQVLTVPEEYRRSWTASPGAGRVIASEVGSRYRGTAVSFNTRPSMALIPNSSVYYVRNDPHLDLYLYGDRWYFVDTNGTWYRAPSWQGPFTSVRTNSVPRDVLTVPSDYRQNWSPPTWVY